MLSKVREGSSQTDYHQWWYQLGIDFEVVRAALGATKAALKEEAGERGAGGGWKWGPSHDMDADGVN